MSDLKKDKNDFNKSGDLSSLVTEKIDSKEGNLDEMLESAANPASNLDNTAQSDNGIDLNFLLTVISLKCQPR